MISMRHGVGFLLVFLAASVTFLGCGSGSGSGGTKPSHLTPTITSIDPPSTAAGSGAIQITVTGTNFDNFSRVEWNHSANGPQLLTTYVNPTTLTAQVPASLLTSVGFDSIDVAEFYYAQPGPRSDGMLFWVVLPLAPGESIIPVAANDLAWDPVHKVIYLSLAGPVNAASSTVQVLDPYTKELGRSATVGNGADLLSVSANSEYLYVALDRAPNVQRLTLPDLGTNISIPLGSDPLWGPYYAMDLQAGPVSDTTVGVVKGNLGISPEEQGGVVIYDDATPRPNALCGFGKAGCSVTYIGPPCCFSPTQAEYDSIRWNANGTEMYAGSGSDFYSIPVSSTGFGTPTMYFGLGANQSLTGSGIHYDVTTGNVYNDDGAVIDPATATQIGTFNASGIMVPDGALGKAFFLGQRSEQGRTSNYTLESFDIDTFAPIASLTITNVTGYPTHLIRWGTDGLAFTTANASNSSPQVYLIQGSFVDGSGSSAESRPTENVRRTWKSSERPSSSPTGFRSINP